MHILDTFAGIGGFSIGFEKNGFETAAFCEIDKNCQKVLAKNWPKVKIYSDIKKITAQKLVADGVVWPAVITGGYPCQPFSNLGQRGGEKDDRHLWPDLCRVIDEIRPAWIVCENVYGHISMGLKQVLADLAAIGYQCLPFVIPAAGVDAHHKRDRLWIVANTTRIGQQQTPGKSGEKRRLLEWQTMGYRKWQKEAISDA